MLTRSGWLVAAAGLALVVTGRLFGLPELFVLGAIALVLVLIAIVWICRPAPALRVEREVRPARVPLGGRSRVELRILNEGRRRAPVAQLVDPVEGTVGARLTLAPLPPGQSHSAGYRLPTDRRGLRHIGPLRLEITDPFGLARRTTDLTGPTAVTVLPAIDTLTGVPVGGGRDEPLAGLVRRATTTTSSEDFAALRPYVVGDDLRRIHWPSSARAGDLLVRQDDLRWQGHVTVVLDTRSDRMGPDAFELAVSAAASVVVAVGREADRVRLLLTEGTDSGLVTARAASDTVLEHLAVAQQRPDGAFPALPTDGRTNSGTLVVVTGTPSTEDLFTISAARSTFRTAIVVAVGADEIADLPPGVEIVRVDARHPFGRQWAAAASRLARVSR